MANPAPSRRRSPQIPGLAQFWQFFENQPLPTPEDSLSLRVLVQALVVLGIIAIDVAAADVADPLWISLWAAPASVIGAAWSWRRRRNRNIPVKFCIAIAMLLALAAFFAKLLGGNTDTRLVLAELLIQLQVFHSFDLPRRKDLGYSIIIGLILMGVSATLSQTLWFAPLLLAFLAIAVPVLMLDYRSRLELPPTQTLKRIGNDLQLKRLGTVLLVVMALGLTIFALLPRLPGYQLRTFPVSTPIEFEGQFQPETIINPGYVREGRGTSGTGTGEGGSILDGPGDLDDDFYYGFNSRMNQNLRGELIPKVVMRVRSQAPGFWRVLAFDHYTGQGWEISRNEEEQVETIDRPPWTFRFNLPWSVNLVDRQEVIQSFTIVSDLPNLIPTLYEPRELYFPTRQVGLDAEGGLRSPIPLSEGLTYTVVSEVPVRDRTQLRSAPTTYPKLIRDYYLDVPADLAARVRETTEAALAEAPNPVVEPYEKALYLAQYLKQNYTIQPDLPFLEEDEDLVEAFLYKYQGGYPDHFSTVLTVMLRAIGIPSRLVVGFGAGEFNPFTGFYIVRNTNAFAMTEVYFPRYGWFSFNPIPGAELVPASVEQSQTFSVLRQFWQWIAGWLPSPVTGFLNQIMTWITQAMGWVIGFFSGLLTRGWVGLLIGLGIITALCLGGWLGWSGWRSWRYRRWLSHLPPMEALYQQLLNWLKQEGLGKSVAQTPLEYAHSLRDRCPPPQADVIQEISNAYVQWRYGQRPQNLDYLRQQLRSLTQRPRKRHKIS